MKKSLKLFSVLFAFIAIAAMSTVFTSCGDDDEPNGTIIYSMAFDKVHVSETGMNPTFGVGDMNLINSTFMKALGVNDVTFTMTGKVSECDAKVKEACEKALKELEGKTWKGEYEFVVRNGNTGKAVFTHTFGE